MPEELIDLIRRLRNQGLTAIQVQKWLRDNNYAIPWVETRKVYLQAGR